MSQDLFRSSRNAAVSSGYRFFRALIRFWTTLAFGKPRVLTASELPPSSPAVFVVSPPGGFLEALFMIAVIDRQVCCLVESVQLRGAWRRFLARRLGMIPFEAEGEGWGTAAESACNVLGNLGAIAIFSNFQAPGQPLPGRFSWNAASLVLESEARNANQLDVRVVPVQFTLSRMKSRAGELFAYFDRRIKPQVYMLAGKSIEERRPVLSAALDEACRKNVFRLQTQDVSRFLGDVKEVLLADLREDFASRQNWKQRVEDFRLSGFISEWVDQLNWIDPGQLASLRQSLSAFREAERCAAMRALEVESAGEWIRSSMRRALGWIETLAGFPVALYGILNHLVIGVVLRVAGLLKRQSGTNRTALWISRAAILLIFYIAQVLLCDHLLGRAAAGYYALSLPIAALYAWRYVLLIRRCTRFLYLRALAPRRENVAREKRRRFVRELNAARNAYVEAVGLSK
ncbi:MAG TPA: hypothetical protein VFM21_12045 [Terriglobia bacterium]|nr:hypothetical protein [Terriglobia bacterium]